MWESRLPSRLLQQRDKQDELKYPPTILYDSNHMSRDGQM